MVIPDTQAAAVRELVEAALENRDLAPLVRAYYKCPMQRKQDPLMAQHWVC